MACSVPGHVVEVNGLYVVLVVVTAQLKGWVGSRLPDAVGRDVVQGAVERISGADDLIRGNTGEEAGRTLRVRVGAMLEGAIHPGDERDLVAYLVEGRQGRGERKRMFSGRDRFAFKSPDVVLTGEARQRAILLPGKEASTGNPVWKVEKSHPLCWFPRFPLLGPRDAFEPGKAEGRPPGAS